MNNEAREINCVILRGGTSKGVYLLEKELPMDPAERDRVLLALFGSPDRRQIDGLGGADPLTSKLAFVAPSDRQDADIEYTFGQVAIEEARAVRDQYGACSGGGASNRNPHAQPEYRENHPYRSPRLQRQGGV